MSGCEFPFSGPSTGQSIEQHIDSLLRAVRFLDLIKPFTPLVPEVAAPETKIPFSQKLMWTGVSQNPPGTCRVDLLQLGTVTNAKDDLVDTVGVSGDESNAPLRHCIIRQLGSSILAPDDVGE